MQTKKLFARPVLPPPQTDIPQTAISRRNGGTIKNHIYNAESDGNMLIVTAYFAGDMAWRLFLTQDDYIVQKPDNKVSTAQISWFVRDWQAKYYAAEGADELILRHFKRYCWYSSDIKYSDWRTWTDGIKAIDALQDKQHKVKLDAKHNKIRQSVDNAMLAIRPVPAGVIKWAIKDVPRHCLFYAKKSKPGICSRCGASVPVKTKHGDSQICPRCHADLLTVCTGRYKDGGWFDAHNYFWYVQSCKDELCKRLFYIQIRFIKNDTHEVYFAGSTYNEIRHITPEWKALISITEHGRYFFKPYGLNYKTYVTKAFEWTDPYREGFNWYQNSYTQTYSGLIYPDSMIAAAKKIPELKYMPMRKLCKVGKIDPCGIFKAAITYPFIEYTAKMGLTRITADVINGISQHSTGLSALSLYDISAKRIYDLLGVKKSDMAELVKLNPSIAELGLYRAMCKAGGYTREAYDFFVTNIRTYNINNLCTALKFVRCDTFLKYVKEQVAVYTSDRGDYYAEQVPYYRRNVYEDIINDYADYIDAANIAGYNLDDTAIIRPHDLHQAHADAQDDEQIARYYREGIEYAEQLAATAAALPEWLTYDNGNYIIRPIATFDELINESRLMRHCVGSYADRYAEGDTIILSVRKLNAPDMPLTTVELQTDYKRFVQRRAYKNSTPTKEIMDFTDKFLSAIKRKAVKAG